MTRTLRAWTVIVLLPFTGCFYEPQETPPLNVEGYEPIYGSGDQRNIAMTTPQTVQNPGKIYRYGDYLLVNEKGRGIHLFDNSDPSHPDPIGFLQMLGNTEITIANNVLYADHMGQIVALTFEDLNHIEETGRLPLTQWDKGVPPPSGSYFKCVDTSEGVVVGWKQVHLKNPSCYAY